MENEQEIIKKFDEYPIVDMKENKTYLNWEEYVKSRPLLTRIWLRISDKLPSSILDVLDGTMYYRVLYKIKHFLQRIVRGWDDSELWELETTYFNFMKTRLKVFIAKIQHYPSHYNELYEWQTELSKVYFDLVYITENHSKKKYCEENQKILDATRKRVYEWLSNNTQHLWL